MADALVSPTVAIVAGAASVGLIAISARKVKNDQRDGLTSMMGVVGAFVFAAQMINFSIPGTGSSGHIIGGVLLAAILGPWAAFLTMCSVLIVQCLIFADGGLMALGCNILNMAVMSCLVAYPFVYRPIARTRKGMPGAGRIMLASVLACVISLELGAILVTIETEASGVTALPFGVFMSVMLPIHLAIGACEGVATGLVLVYLLKNSPSMLMNAPVADGEVAKKRRKRSLIAIGACALIFALSFTWLASTHPDGLEWSIQKITGSTELSPSTAPSTAVIADYNSYFSGIIGAVIVMAILWGMSVALFRHKKSA